MKLSTLLISAGILALLAGIVIPTVPHCGPSVETALTQTRMQQVSVALQIYCLEYGAFPADLDSAKIIKALARENPRKLSFYSPGEEVAKTGELIDGWQHPVIYKKIPEGLLMRSAGKDGIHYTKDDVTITIHTPEAAKRATH